MVMGTASTMAIIAETLGFTLAGAATAPAVSSDRLRIAEATGRRAAEMAVIGGPSPRDIVSHAALRNASVVLQAIGGSTNAIVHLAAVAGRAGLAYDLAELDRIGRETPVLLNLKPAGRFFMEDFHAGGGLPALWRRLQDYLDLSAPTVGGETLGDVVARWPAYLNPEVIRPLDRPVCAGRGDRHPRRQSRAAGCRDQACRGDGRAVHFPRTGPGVRLARRPCGAHRRSQPTGHPAALPGAAQCRPDRRARHAGSGRPADSEKARRRRA